MASILGQTHRDLTCLVVNDGDDPAPLRAALDGIDDGRLVVVDLPHNRGRYFVDAVTAQACLTEWWVPHDADDASEPHRIEALLAAAEQGTDAVFSPFTNHREDGRVEHRAIRGRTPDRRMRYTAHLSQLWRTSAARRLTHPGYRVAYDAVMTTAALYYGHVVIHGEPSYHRIRQPESLVTSVATGRGSPHRRETRQKLKRLWRRIDTGSSTLDDAGRWIHADTDPGLVAEVDEQAARLRETLLGGVGDRVREQRDRVG
ncbi:glycosyltransferase involved in cell wall biosynthesis [Lipingzhangella halophila]|uniref:Glycosyltransferase involved in cell wall biosynthesis n=1 Tax=Lipingzhangella halophila TaxID=1783352 RepID=A0A7W7W752_9ACTN|nr:glycosyltransferase family 2 protein [Lipingzhangella halophila]MBB4935654.1 glycosyltransferase involved in cell wall biosynthesis [Lipingzhangella halophila]